MKKRVLFTLTIVMIFNILFAKQSSESLDNWIVKQPDTITTDNIINFLNGERGEGDILFGNEVIFNPSSTQNISALKLDTNHFVVVFMDEQNSYKGTGMVGTISGNTITYGSKFVFNAGMTFDISATVLDETHFAVAYRDGNNSFYGTTSIGTVSGNNITYGSKAVFNFGDNQFISIKNLTPTNFVIAYMDNSNSFYGTAIVGTLTGSTISFGNEFVFNSGTTTYISVTNMGVSSFIISYKDEDNFGIGTSLVANVTGNTISFGSSFIFNNANTEEISTSPINNSSFVIAYTDYGNSRNGTAIVGTISGNTISFGSEYVFNTFMTSYISVSMLNDDRIIIAYDDADITYTHFGSAIIGTLTANTISFGSEYVFNPERVFWCSTVNMATDNFIIAYMDEGYNHSGTSIIGQVESQAPPSIPISSWSIIFGILLIGTFILIKWFK